MTTRLATTLTPAVLSTRAAIHRGFRDGSFCPWVQRVDPATKRPLGSPRPVLHLHDARLRVASGAAATNDVQGGYFYFTATESTGQIWLLKR